jgi:magnesium transporter
MTLVRQWVTRHPMIIAWAVLAVAMVAMLLYSARDVDLLASQRLALVLATVGLAGACVWILTWE